MQALRRKPMIVLPHITRINNTRYVTNIETCSLYVYGEVVRNSSGVNPKTDTSSGLDLEFTTND